MPYVSASAVVIHYEEALYQVYGPLPLPLSVWTFSRSKGQRTKTENNAKFWQQKYYNSVMVSHISTCFETEDTVIVLSYEWWSILHCITLHYVFIHFNVFA